MGGFGSNAVVRAGGRFVNLKCSTGPARSTIRPNVTTRSHIATFPHQEKMTQKTRSVYWVCDAYMSYAVIRRDLRARQCRFDELR